MTTTGYAEFLRSKSQLGGEHGFAPLWVPDFLKPFQGHLAEWNCRKGRAGTFADCGLGKTVMQLVVGENVVRKTNRPYLIAAPLAVAAQTVREADKFGIDAVQSRDGKYKAGARIVVTNYERLKYFDPADFAGMGCDESGGLKNFAGRRRKDVTEFLRTLPYRHLWSATQAPNDYVELGTASEAVGDLGHQDMLARFFKHDDDTIFLHGTKHGDLSQNKWRFKPHAETPFWRWVCSWARACRRPSDLGFDDAGYDLPDLVLREHEVEARTPRAGLLYDVPARTLDEQREEQRRTVRERCERVAELVAAHDQSLVWCHLNEEGDLLTKLIPGAVQVKGSDRDEVKEERLLAFAAGQIKRLVTKTTIAGFGLNFQGCAHQTYFPSHSFEQYYQGVRRCWRFGQTRPVCVDIVTTPGSAVVLANWRRKAAAADRLFTMLVRNMTDALAIGAGRYGDRQTEVPKWL